MTVNTLTLYMPGSSVGMQVVEGGQLHLIYVAMGANSIPSAPGQTVRQDPFPQYVDDEELAAALSGVGGGGAVDSVNGQVGAVVLDAGDIGGLATVATTGAYADLSDKPTIPAAYTDEQVRDVIGTTLVAGANVTITPNDGADTITIAAAGGTAWLDAKLDFGAVGNDSADDTAALDAAVAAAIAQKRPLYIPAGTYRRTTPWDLRSHGLVVRGFSRDVSSGQATVIKQMTSNTAVIRLGRRLQNISDLVATYATAPTSAHTSANAFEFYKAFWGTYARLWAYQVGRGFEIPQVDYNDGDTATANGVFSCQFDSCRVAGYAINAIRFNNYGGGGTGNVWTNTYISNNPLGTRLAPSGCAIEMKITDETVFNQLNIEWMLVTAAQPSAPLYFESGGNIIINGLHLEQISLQTNTEAFIIVSDGNKVTINGLCLSNNQVTNAGTHALARFFGDSYLTVNNIDAHDNTVAGIFVIANVGSGTAGVSSVRVTDSETAIFTAIASGEKAAPQQIVREVNGNMYRWQQNGKNHTTGTAAPTAGTWAVGDTVWNTAPAAAGAPGWVCVTAGTPGTWKAMASLAA